MTPCSRQGGDRTRVNHVIHPGGRTIPLRTIQAFLDREAGDPCPHGVPTRSLCPNVEAAGDATLRNAAKTPAGAPR